MAVVTILLSGCWNSCPKVQVQSSHLECISISLLSSAKMMWSIVLINYILLQFVDHIYWVNHFSTFHLKFNFKNAKFGHFITKRSHTILSILEFLSDFVSKNCQKWFCSLISLQFMCQKAIFFVLSYFSPSKGLIITKHLS